MKNVFKVMILVTLCILSASCSKNTDISSVYDTSVTTETEFALHSGDISVALNEDIANFEKEPIKVKDGSGDGFSWSEYEYYDITVKALKTDSAGVTNIIKIATSSPDYETSRGIKTGDKAELLKERYPEFLYYQENNESGDFYLYDPEGDIGFKKIRFYVENEIIKTIELEDTIDG